MFVDDMKAAFNQFFLHLPDLDDYYPGPTCRSRARCST